jgi:hypothetical protein
MTISITTPEVSVGIVDVLAQAGADMLDAFANCTALISGDNFRCEFRRKRDSWQAENIRAGGVEGLSLSAQSSAIGSVVARGDTIVVTHDSGVVETYLVADYSRIHELDRIDFVLEAVV